MRAGLIIELAEKGEKMKYTIVFWLLSIGFGVLPLEALEAKVETKNGVPQLIVNEQNLRPHLFCNTYRAYKGISVTSKDTSFSIDGTARAGNEKGFFLSFRFSLPALSTLRLGKIQLIDLSDGKNILPDIDMSRIKITVSSPIAQNVMQVSSENASDGSLLKISWNASKIKSPAKLKPFSVNCWTSEMALPLKKDGRYRLLFSAESEKEVHIVPELFLTGSVLGGAPFVNYSYVMNWDNEQQFC